MSLLIYIYYLSIDVIIIIVIIINIKIIYIVVRFPSGHAATAYAGWVFFVLYINGKLKPWAGGAHLWKILILLFPLYFATWISLTRVMDYNHFMFQIILGGLMGIGAALISYRAHFGNNGWFLGI